ncbi:MAG TPA: long-chain fatty acid--CoA ligase [Syntrophomonadaceae bacterium]|nr:long-chain fatty acid--CoA ligase [Syntrophomonadaceae bacterium]
MLKSFIGSVNTLPQMFYNTVDNFGERPAMKFKLDGTYVTLNYRGFANIVEEMGTGLMSLGLKPGECVGLMAHTSQQWGWADWSIQNVGGIVATIYPTLSSEETAFIANHSEAKFIMAGNDNIAKRVLSVWDEMPGLEKVIVLDSKSDLEDEKVINITTLKKLGKTYASENPEAYKNKWQSIKGDDPSSIIYTSGTMGELKGSLLTHNELIGALTRSVKHLIIGGYNPSYNDVAFSLLPLAHIWERNNSYLAMIAVGGLIGFAEKPTTLLQDIQEIKPTWVLLVPRLWDRIFSGFKGAFVSSPEGKKIFDWAFDIGEKVLAARTNPNGAVDFTADPTIGLDEALAADFKRADAMVFSQLRQLLGGNLQIAYSGGGHLPVDLHYNFMVLNFPLLNGWGLTETAAGISHGYPNATKVGWLSKIVPGVDVKLAEDGEILVKGIGIITEYYKNPEETKEAFTDDGWFKTGDLGEMDDEGFLRIVDRKKDILVMDTGKNVAPAKIELKFTDSPVIEQVMVVGDNRKFISALLVPAFDMILFMLGDKGTKFDESKLKFAEINGVQTCIEVGEDVVNNDFVKNLIDDEVKRINQYLEDFEQIKAYSILTRKFTEEDGELTPTMKIKRKVVTKHYEDKIEVMYK